MFVQNKDKIYIQHKNHIKVQIILCHLEINRDRLDAPKRMIEREKEREREKGRRRDI